MQEWKTEREAVMGAGPGAVVCCSVAAVPCAAAPAAAGNRLPHPAGHRVPLHDARHHPGPRGWAGVVVSALECLGWGC